MIFIFCEMSEIALQLNNLKSKQKQDFLGLALFVAKVAIMGLYAHFFVFCLILIFLVQKFS